MVLFSFGAVYAGIDDLIAEASFTIFSEYEWAHVSVAGETVGSVAWESYGPNVQIVFYAYNDTGLSFHQEVIEANRTYSDPFNKYMVFWEGEISVEGEISFKFFSFSGQTTTVVESFSGEPSPYERPGTAFTKSIITSEGEIRAVFGEDDSGQLDEHICSFEWSFVTTTSNITNATKTVPTMVTYKPDGGKHDTKTLSITMSPVIEYWAQVGFMVEEMDVDEGYVKWIIYSGQDFRIGTSPSFRDKDLPLFRVDPVGLRVEPGQTVTVNFKLPEGITEYEASWTGSKIWEHIDLLDDLIFPDGEHEVTFQFLESYLEGERQRKATIRVSCELYGTTYSGSDVVRVQASALIEILAMVCVGVGALIGGGVGLRWLLRRRSTPPSGEEVTSRGLGE